MITGCNNNPFPRWTDDIHLGNNKLGGLSVIAFKEYVLFDESLKWLLDCDFYKRMYELYGKPYILETKNVTIGTGNHQMTNILTDKEKEREVELMKLKYV
jgi:hypothetical protein